MYEPFSLLPFFILVLFFPPSSADIGTTTQYSPPYTPTACFGNDMSQFPSNNYFAAAGEGIWENGAACGRKYLVRCISSVIPKACKKGEMILIRIVDRAQTSISRPTRPETTMVLSKAAFAAIADYPASWVNIEYEQLIIVIPKRVVFEYRRFSTFGRVAFGV